VIAEVKQTTMEARRSFHWICIASAIFACPRLSHMHMYVYTHRRSLAVETDLQLAYMRSPADAVPPRIRTASLATGQTSRRPALVSLLLCHSSDSRELVRLTASAS
jgi:hypothetical protein